VREVADLTCCDCHEEFLFSSGERQFFDQRGFDPRSGVPPVEAPGVGSGRRPGQWPQLAVDDRSRTR
jgi:hypothetical protein